MQFSAAFLALVLPIFVAELSLGATISSRQNNNNNLQTSRTLDNSVIAPGFAQNGQNAPGAAAGQVPSLTSTNNFINFCAGQTITNGQQNQDGSCNPAPMGQIPNIDNMPSGKIQFPTNLQNLPANTRFTIRVAMARIQMGNFVNAQSNYYSAPQQINRNGQIIGHTHVVVEQVSGLGQQEPTNPRVFQFFKGINGNVNAQGQVTADVEKGLAPGIYRLATINAAVNHQPVLAPVAQHGSLDDMVYFSVGSDGQKQMAATVPQGAFGNFPITGVQRAGGTNNQAAAPPAAAPPANNNNNGQNRNQGNNNNRGGNRNGRQGRGGRRGRGRRPRAVDEEEEVEVAELEERAAAVEPTAEEEAELEAERAMARAYYGDA